MCSSLRREHAAWTQPTSLSRQRLGLPVPTVFELCAFMVAKSSRGELENDSGILRKQTVAKTDRATVSGGILPKPQRRVSRNSRATAALPWQRHFLCGNRIASLHIGPVTGPVEAVRAAIVAEHKSEKPA